MHKTMQFHPFITLFRPQLKDFLSKVDLTLVSMEIKSTYNLISTFKTIGYYLWFLIVFFKVDTMHIILK